MKTKSQATNPNVFTFFPFIKPYILFIYYVLTQRKQFQKSYFKEERQISFTSGLRDNSILKADI